MSVSDGSHGEHYYSSCLSVTITERVIPFFHLYKLYIKLCKDTFGSLDNTVKGKV